MGKSLFTLISLFLIIACFSYADGAADSKYALIITIDGLRPDAVSKETTPNLSELIKEGSFSATAITVTPPKTVPSHTSLVTGLSPEKHGMYKNKWSEDNGHVQFDTVFTMAKKNGLSTAMFLGKKKLKYLEAPGSVDMLSLTDYSPESTRQISESYRGYIKTRKPALTFVHFPEPDMTGHQKSWMSEEYFAAIKGVDAALGEILEAMKEAGVYDETLIIITSDHGGSGKTHGEDIPKSYEIPWLAVGKEIKTNYTIKEQVYIYDTAPTILHALGIKPLENIDGNIIKEIFTQ